MVFPLAWDPGLPKVGLETTSLQAEPRTLCRISQPMFSPPWPRPCCAARWHLKTSAAPASRLDACKPAPPPQPAGRTRPSGTTSSRSSTRSSRAPARRASSGRSLREEEDLPRGEDRRRRGSWASCNRCGWQHRLIPAGAPFRMHGRRKKFLYNHSWHLLDVVHFH